MRAMNISLPTGAHDWSADRIPRSEFDARVALARAAMRVKNIALLIVHGDTFDHGALTWLTGFTPKLGPAFALFALEGGPRLIFSGSPGMKASALKLSWIVDMASQGDLAGDIGEWAAAHGGGAVGLCEGAAMAEAGYAAVTRGAGAPPKDMSADIDALRAEKSPLETAFIRDAGRAVEAALKAASLALPRGRRAAIIAGERAACAAGAQDARVLIADHARGAPRPLDDNDPIILSAVPVAVAARVNGYWASAESVLGDVPADLADEARRALLSVVEGRGLPPADSARWSLSSHGIGLSLEEAPGDVLCARIGFKGQPGQYLAWSAMRAGAQTLCWPF